MKRESSTPRVLVIDENEEAADLFLTRTVQRYDFIDRRLNGIFAAGTERLMPRRVRIQAGARA